MDDCRILGMDNSTKSTGWAVVDVVDGRPVLVDYGLIKRGSRSIAEVLVDYEAVFTDLLTRFKPDHVSAEQMFIGANRATAMALAYIHGVMLLTAQKLGVPVTYYSVMTAKSATLGGITMHNARGERKTSAELKLEVQAKVFEVLGKERFDHEYTDDVTDACSLALTYLYMDGVGAERRARAVRPRKAAKKKVAKKAPTKRKTASSSGSTGGRRRRTKLKLMDVSEDAATEGG